MLLNTNTESLGKFNIFNWLICTHHHSNNKVILYGILIKHLALVYDYIHFRKQQRCAGKEKRH